MPNSSAELVTDPLADFNQLAGDWVFGDADGIIVGSRAEIEPLMDTAEAIVRNEGAARNRPIMSHISPSALLVMPL